MTEHVLYRGSGWGSVLAGGTVMTKSAPPLPCTSTRSVRALNWRHLREARSVPLACVGSSGS